MYKYIILVAYFFICSAYSAVPNSLTVTSLEDDGSAGTLRWAILTANSDSDIDQIAFTSGLIGTIVLTSDLPVVTSNLTITGPGAADLTISGNNLYKMFSVNNGSVLTVLGITFTANTSFNGSIFRADNNNSSIIADSINVTANTRSYAFYTNNSSTITISNSTFTSNSSTLFGSDYGSTPSITSDVETDYSNRITVTGSTFDANTGIIFSTERYVKIDDCVFSNNTSQIGSFRGVNRYQVLNSTFTNNTGGTLFSFSSWIGQTPSWGESTLGTNNTLFEGNTFIGNTGTVINPGGSSNYYNKTSIIDNTFINNGVSYTGTPAVISSNILDNFISSVSHSVLESTLVVTMSRAVFNTNTGSGAIEASDFELLLTGGNATLTSSIPSAITANGNVYTLEIAFSGEISGEEIITVKPLANSVFDASFNVAGTSQQNNSISLNFLDADADGVSNFLDLCPNSLSGVRVYPYNGCEDTTYPFITNFNYGSTLNYPSNIISATDQTLYFTSYDSNWNISVNKLTPEKVISTVFSPTNGYVQSLSIDTSDNLYYSYYDYLLNSNEIRKITPNGTTSVLLNSTGGEFQNMTTDATDNIYIIENQYSINLTELKKINNDGTVTVLDNDNQGYFQNLVVDKQGNSYYFYSNNTTNLRIIKKVDTEGSISELYSTSYYFENMKIDTLGNLYFILYNSTDDSYELKKLSLTGSVSNVYSLSNGYIQSIAVDAMNNLYFATYDYNNGQRQINSITPEGIIIPYGEYSGNELYSDKNGTIYFNDYLNKKIMTTKQLLFTTVLSDFNAITKYYFDGSFTITPPSTDSSGAFSYISSDTNVATISGTTVTIVGAGVTTITATQGADATHLTNSISADLTVNTVSVLTNNGQITTTNTNYVNKYGGLSLESGIDANGKVKITRTSTSQMIHEVTIPFENYFDLETNTICDGSCEMNAPNSYDLIFAAGAPLVRARMWWNEQYANMALVYDKSFNYLSFADISNYYFCDYIGDNNAACTNVDTPPTNFRGIYQTHEGNYFVVEYISEDDTSVTFKYRKLN